MQMKSIIILAIVLVIPIAGNARGFHMGTSYHRSYGSIHSVRPHVTKRGVYRQWHLSANPQSGMRCRGNICGPKTW